MASEAWTVIGNPSSENAYEPVGVVRRGEFMSPCSCGGVVQAYGSGEVISHSLPLNLEEEHQSLLPGRMPKLLFDYKLVE